VLGPLLVLLALVHTDSFARVRGVVRGEEVVLTVSVQLRSLVEEVAGLDADGDGGLGTTELEAGRARVEEVLGAGYRLRALADGGAGSAGEEILSARLEALSSEEPRPGEEPGARAVLRYRASRPIERLELASRLFAASNPRHRDLVELGWEGEAPETVLLGGGTRAHVFRRAAERRPGVFASFLRLGVDHILSGWDHLAFLLALCVAARGARALVGVVSAFTLAHSLTLALAALGVVSVPARPIELAIALSIVWVAGETLLRRAPRNPWPEAFAFGLLHGLGFAGFLSEALSSEPLVATALLAFNVGVELGQLAIVAAFVLALLALRARGRGTRASAESPPALAPAWLRVGASALVALAGLGWFLARAA
jgi:hydrogenase/urease accessory protein HupE